MDERTLGWLDILGRVLLWGAVCVVGLAVVAAISIAGSETAIPGLDEIQRQNRGVVAVMAFGSGVAAGGVMAGLGGILRMMVADRLDRRNRTSD